MSNELIEDQNGFVLAVLKLDKKKLILEFLIKGIINLISLYCAY
jgi:hypothetical protein